MIRALAEYELQGIHSTIPFLIKVLQHKRFINGDFTTHFITEEPSLFSMNEKKAEIAALAATIFYEKEKNKKKFQTMAGNTTSNWKIIKRKNILDRE
jgi:pyruvate carboxylase